MKIKFGDFEEVEKPDYVKQKLTEFFEPLQSSKFNEVFIAYPHQCYSGDYSPKTENGKTMELYIFSLPDGFKAEPHHLEMLTFGNKDFLLKSGQKDFLSVTSPLSKNMDYLLDDRGVCYAIHDLHHIWILGDICHGMGVDTSVNQVIDEMLQSLAELFIDEMDPKEMEKAAVAVLNKSIKASLEHSITELRTSTGLVEAEVKQTETRLGKLIRDLSEKEELLAIATQYKKPNGEEIYERCKNMKWIDKIGFRRNVLHVKTNRITLGPFDYGVWEIFLHQSVPAFKHELSGKQRHCYEHGGNSGFCMGGFTDRYIRHIQQGEVDKALAVCRMEITQYDYSTKMIRVEDFLSEMMGKAKFDKIIQKVVDENFKESKSARIIMINGRSVTYAGTNPSRNEEKEVLTQERVVIDYE